MSKKNTKDVGKFIRMTQAEMDHLSEKARRNPDNKHNFVATEISSLIATDMTAMRARKVSARK